MKRLPLHLLVVLVERCSRSPSLTTNDPSSILLNSNSSLGLGIAVDLISWESLAVEFEF